MATKWFSANFPKAVIRDVELIKSEAVAEDKFVKNDLVEYYEVA